MCVRSENRDPCMWCVRGGLNRTSLAKNLHEKLILFEAGTRVDQMTN